MRCIGEGEGTAEHRVLNGIDFDVDRDTIEENIALADLLIQVVNLRSFGWTMETRIPPATLISGVVLGWSAALAAGLYPAYRSAGANPAVAPRSE
jgi:hypothetical protein